MREHWDELRRWGKLHYPILALCAIPLGALWGYLWVTS